MSSINSISSTTHKSPFALVHILPLEVLQEVGPYLRGTRDIANLRLASFHFSRVFAPFFVNELTLELPKKKPRRHIPESVNTAVTFTHFPPSLAPYIKVLYISINNLLYCDQFDAMVDEMTQEVAWLRSLKEFSLSNWHGIKPEMIPRGRMVEERLLSLVLQANRETLETLDLAYLNILSQDTPLLHLPKSILTFKTLRLCHVEYRRFIAQAKEVLAHSNVIESLEIVVPIFTDGPVLFIQDMVPSASIVPHLSLRNLLLNGPIGFLPGPPLMSISLFTHLRRLTMEQSDLGIPRHLDNFWDFLRATNVQLEYLHLDWYGITLSLFNFLTSYKGLRTILFDSELTNEVTPAEHDLMAKACCFHAATLTQLAIISAPPGDGFEEDGGLLVFSWLSPTLFLNLRCLSLLGPIVANETFAQGMVDWLGAFPALEQVSSEWAPDDYQSASFPLDDLVKKLVGRTGRPQYWKWNLPQSACDYPVCFVGSQRSPTSEGEWNFVRILADPEFEVVWDLVD